MLGGADWPSDTYLTNCKDYYDPGGTPAKDQLRTRILQVVAPRVQQTVAAVAQRAPNAKVFFVDYLAISPDAASAPDPSTYPGSCYLSLFNSQAFPFGAVDTPYLAMEQKLFNDAIDTAAAAAGAGVVKTYGGSLTHTACAGTADPWVNGITIKVFQQAGRAAVAPSSTAPSSTAPSSTAPSSSAPGAGGTSAAATTSAGTGSTTYPAGSSSVTRSATSSSVTVPTSSSTSVGRAAVGSGTVLPDPTTTATAPKTRVSRAQLGASVAVGSLHPNLEGAVYQAETVTRALLQAFPQAPSPVTTRPVPAPTTTSSAATTRLTTSATRRSSPSPSAPPTPTTTAESTTEHASGTNEPSEPRDAGPVLASTGPAPIRPLLFAGTAGVVGGGVLLAAGRGRSRRPRHRQRLRHGQRLH